MGKILLLLLLSFSAMSAERKDYRFPLKDSLRATFLAAIYRPMNLLNWPEYQPNQAKALGVRYLTVEPSLERATPRQIAENCDAWKLDPVFGRQEKSGTFRFGWNNLWGQYEYVTHNKILLIVPGIAASWDNHIATYLAEFALQNGFRPIVVDSPFHPEFIRRTSRNGLIGNTAQDAEDLYGALQWAAACAMRDMTREYDSYVNGAVDTGRLPRHLAKRYKKRYHDGAGVYLLGYSLGALQAAYLSQIDREKNGVRFKRVLLVNPPVHQKHGLETIDSFGRPKQKLSFFEWLFKLLLGPTAVPFV